MRLADIAYERLAEPLDLARGDLQRVVVITAAAQNPVVGEQTGIEDLRRPEQRAERRQRAGVERGELALDLFFSGQP